MRVMVAGGGGFFAKHLTRKLVDAGHTVRVAELPTRDVADLEALGVEVIAGDLCDPAVATRACAGMEVVFN